MKITRQELGKKSKAQLTALFKRASQNLKGKGPTGQETAETHSILRQIAEELQRRTPEP